MKIRNSYRFHMRISLFLGLMICFTAGLATAQMEFGIRAGASVDPDQFHFGVHAITDPLMDNFTFRPNLEIGIGNDITAIAANFEFAYSIPVPDTELLFYAGAGPSLLVYRFSDSHPRGGNTDAGGGFNILFGLEHGNGLMGEIKVGAIDSPELKFTVGYTFR